MNFEFISLFKEEQSDGLQYVEFIPSYHHSNFFRSLPYNMREKRLLAGEKAQRLSVNTEVRNVLLGYVAVYVWERRMQMHF